MSRPKRPTPSTIESWQNRRFGLFIHWGLYSLLGGVWEGKPISGYNEQIQAHSRIPNCDYAKLANDFNPVLWDPDAVVALAKAAGMKFIVITSKHHDGFSLFETAYSDFNVVSSTPYGKDIVEGLADACKRGGLEFGVYFSTIDWHFEGGTGMDFDDEGGIRNDNLIPEAHAAFNANQLTELMTKYGSISEVWFDMGSPTLDQSELFADTVHEHQPEAMVSGRVFNYQGDFTVMGDNEIPPYPLEEPWQSPASIYHETWGYRSWQKHDDLASKTKEHLKNLIRVVSRGGNYLLNIGPRGDGSIVEFEEDVLRDMGAWLAENQEAIEGTSPQPFRNLDFGAATTCGNRLYLFLLSNPKDGRLVLPGLTNKILSARWLGNSSRSLVIRNSTYGAEIEVGEEVPTSLIPVVVIELDGLPEIQAPALSPDDDGGWMLRQDSADTFSHRNGSGYYDPPKLYKMRWALPPSAAGTYQVSLELADILHNAPVQIKIGSRIQFVIPTLGAIDLGTIELLANTPTEITISPVEPFEKGIGLSAAVNAISLVPLK